MMYNPETNHSIFVEKQIRVPTFTMAYEHSHSYCEIFYLKTGSCVYYINGNMVNLSAGDFFVVPPLVSHYTRYEGQTPCERILVNCHLDALPESFLRLHEALLKSFSRPVKLILPRNQIPHLENLLDSLIDENNIPGVFSGELLMLYTLELLVLLHRNSIFVYEQLKTHSEFDSDIESVLLYIAQNYAQNITLENVAETVSLTPTYLSRKFRTATGMTFKEYLNYVRIKRASQSLLTTDDSITKIALDCGFNSSNYFKDLFRKITGISPRAFRKQAADNSFEYNMPEISYKEKGKYFSPIDHS